MADHMRTELVSDALQMAPASAARRRACCTTAIGACSMPATTISSYWQSHQMEVSMSGRGDCWDNACIESFWGTLKTELVSQEHYATRDEARASIFEYIEVFYNRKRMHSSLGYKSPEAFEASLN